MTERLDDVVRLDATAVGEVVDVFADAFFDYPVMRYVLGDTEAEYRNRLNRLITFFVSARALKGEPMFGVERDGRLVAAATVSFPGAGESPPELVSLREETWRELGDDARGRYDDCVRAWTTFEVEEHRTHLNMIGVRRDAQGEGLARLLLRRVHLLSAELPASAGVSLTTEDAANVPFYERAGYQVVARADIADAMTTWSFFRRDRADGD